MRRSQAGHGPEVGSRQPQDMTGERTGVLLLDKPPGPSSFYMVRQVRRILGVKKVGHAGTLDPFASGVLIVCIGRPATRKISLLMATDKEYVATLRLGVETSTQDPEGEIIAEREVPPLDEGDGRALSGGIRRGDPAAAAPVFCFEARRQAALLLCPKGHRGEEGTAAGDHSPPGTLRSGRKSAADKGVLRQRHVYSLPGRRYRCRPRLRCPSDRPAENPERTVFVAGCL